MAGMRFFALSLALLLLFVAFGETSELKAADAAKFAVEQAKLLRPSAVVVKHRGVTKPSSNRWKVLLVVDGEQCEMEVTEKEIRIGFTNEGSPFDTVKNTAKDCVLCC